MQMLITLPVIPTKDNATISLKDDGENPIVGANVTIDGETETSDSDGKVVFSLDYGDYDISVVAEGYIDKQDSISFRRNHKNFTVIMESE